MIKEDHYCIPPLQRVDWEEIQVLIAQKRYFLLHAPRQTGKTSVLMEMMEVLNEEGKYSVLYINIEAAQAARECVRAGIQTICGTLVRSARYYLREQRLSEWLYSDAGKNLAAEEQFNALLSYWAEISIKPTVLFIDEADTLIGDTLVSMLRQLRSGYGQRPEYFPHSVVLCGLRDIKDYRIHVSNGDIISGGSAFNIKAESLRMNNFTQDEIRQLYQQHTEASGQAFAEDVFKEVWEDTKGQPWLVNAMGRSMTWEDKSARVRSTPITLERYKAARERLIQSRTTHLDQLTDKLSEARVHAVISQILSSEQAAPSISTDDVQYVADLGLIETTPQIRISNRIYQEVIPRELIWSKQVMLAQETAWYLNPDHSLNMSKLLQAFQQYFRENSDSWIERFDYKEAGPQLLLQTFLQRIINGGGRINREYGLGRKRTDLSIEWPLDTAQGFYGPIQRIVIELKIQHGSLEAALQQGLTQTHDYASHWGADEAHLVIFNRNPKTSWDKKIWHQQQQVAAMQIHVWGC